jgi:hypothetical protein
MNKTVLLLVGAVLLSASVGSSPSYADDGVDCYLSNTLPKWLKDEACYRASYKACLGKKALGAPLSADCNVLLDNPPQPKGACTADNHINNTPGCISPQVRDQASD